ncbi:MAG: branched-chain amino acid ABC transporter permease, partial [Eubacteriales bacterium]
SLNLVVGFLGELSLGHAGFMCVGAYIGGYFAMALKEVIPQKLVVLILAMLVGGLVSAVFGFIIGLPSLRLKGDYLAIVTLAFGEIVRNVFKNQQSFGGAMGLQTGALRYDTRQKPMLFAVTLVVALIMLFLIQNFIRSKHGRAVTAIRDNEIAAKAMGINVTFYKLFVFILAAFFAGVAGVIYSHYTSPVIYTFFSYNYSIEILVMVVLGGMGSITGSIIAAVLIPTVNYFLQSNVPPEFAAIRYLVYALVLIVIVLFGNAPALKGFREKYGIDSLKNHLASRNRKVDPAKRKDDEATWDRIPSKIDMDALLTTDINPGAERGDDAKGGTDQ